MSDPKKKKPEPPKEVEVFFNRLDSSYWMRVAGRFIALDKRAMQQEFYSLGINKMDWFPAESGNLPAFEWMQWFARRTRGVDFCGPLSGRKCGLFDSNGNTFLVTREANLEEPPKRLPEPEFFKQFVQELLPEDKNGIEQWMVVCHWLAISLRTLLSGRVDPAQILILAGEVGSGKSLFQWMLTQILGGRTGNPTRYMNGDTTFNEDFAGTEHWAIEELRSGTKTRDRVELGENLKDLATTRQFSLHPKGKQAILMDMFRRVSISINDEPDILRKLPPLNGSIDDKIILCHCAKVVKSFDRFRRVEGTPSLLKETERDGKIDKEVLQRAFFAELPAVRSWLLRTFKDEQIPKENRDDRFIIGFYHHPELREQLVSFTPEVRLLAICDEVLWESGAVLKPWEGKAVVLEQCLKESKYRHETFGQCGALLGRLKKSQPERVSNRVHTGTTYWIIQPPVTNGEH